MKPLESSVSSSDESIDGRWCYCACHCSCIGCQCNCFGEPEGVIVARVPDLSSIKNPDMNGTNETVGFFQYISS